MPSEDAHLEVALRNQEAIDYLSAEIGHFSAWVTTVAFYKALHIVEAVFANDPRIGHGQSHEARERHLKTNRRDGHIYKHYRPLWAASMVARYLESGGKHYGSFSDYCDPEQVKSEFLSHRLRQIEKSASRFLSAGAREALK